MTAASADLTQVKDTDGPVRRIAAKIKNAAQIYVGAFGAWNGGYLKAWTSASGEMLGGPISAGVGYGTGLGSTSASPVPEAAVTCTDYVRQRATVTGVTAITDVGSPVYLSDDQAFTLTRPSLGVPCGYVCRWYSSTTCDVHVFGLQTLRALELAGAGKFTVPLGMFGYADITTAKKYFYWLAPHHGKIVALRANVGTTFANGTSIVWQAKIGSTSVTNGTLTFGTDAAETVISEGGTLAANEFHEGDVITLTPTVTGSYNAGAAHVSFSYVPLLGL